LTSRYRAASLMERQGWTPELLVERLQRLSARSVLRDFNLFYEIVSPPRPTYLRGLTQEAEGFIQRRTQELALRNGQVSPVLRLEALEGPVNLRDVSVTYRSRVRRTSQTQAIQRAFGISPDQITHGVIRNITLTVRAGDIVLVTGASGSGKTTLLNLFAGPRQPGVSGVFELPRNYCPGLFTPIRSRKALIEVLGDRDAASALQLMGLVGLSDAFVYLKRFHELSNGQRYRAMVARLVTSGANTWLADEFCANLDPLTANVVADRLQRIARELKATLIVASSQAEPFVASLRPDQVVQLTTAWDHRVMPGPSFLRLIRPRRGSFDAPALRVSPEYLTAVRSGCKFSTIRRGRFSLELGLLLLTAKGDTEPVQITGIRHTRVRCLTDADAQLDGFRSLPELRHALKRHYEDLRDSSWVTVVSFRPFCTSAASAPVHLGR
jgi:ABC-type lipoprotein export system ATPase subunit